MMTLYGVYRSRASRPLWLLSEIGLPFTSVPVIQSDRLADPSATAAPLNTASPAFLAISPLGQIPVLVDDDLILTESLAITLHIARCHGGMLGPQSLAETALMDQWALFAATAIEGPARAILNTVEAGGIGTAEGQAAIARSAQTLQRPLGRLQALFSGHPFLIGNRFTVADLNLAECLRYAQVYPVLIAEFPAVNDWLMRCQQRPAFQVMFQGQQAEMD